MIKEVRLKGLPCFDSGATLSDLTTINYVFGPNGSGKTTISQYLATYDPANNSSVNWSDQQANTIKVYNRNYARAAFTSIDGEEAGVFLLGDASRETYQRIQALEDQQREISSKITRYKNSLEESRDSLAKKQEALSEVVWERRAEIPEILQLHMTGLRGKKKDCLKLVLDAAESHPSRGKDTFDDLVVKAQTAFDKDVTAASFFPPCPKLGWDEVELCRALETPIVASADISLTELIDQLSISDWVREGIDHFHKDQNTKKVCPFCQQKIPTNFVEDLERVFDDTYEQRRKEVAKFEKQVNQTAAEVRTYKTSNFNRLEQYAGADRVSRVFRSLSLAIEGVLKSVQQKILKPSDKVETVSVRGEYEQFEEMLTEANGKIEEANDIVSDRTRQRSAIIEAAWREFARGYLNDPIESFIQEKEDLQKAIDGIRKGIEAQEHLLNEVEKELRHLRRNTRSSHKTIQDINKLLELSQFHSFKLDKALNKPDGYRIIRDGGQLADIETLSEGERTFVTFLYYYHSLAAVRQDEETESVVAVVDDPISSLDGDIMFVVSALMRRLVDEVRKGAHKRVSQVIMLTHSTRFHNEVCYRHNGELSPAVKFYRLRKLSPDPCEIEDCGERNPIRTAYQELWDEVATAESRPKENMPWLPNVLRRIIESYFETLGGKSNLYEIGEGLPSNERVVHDALIAWSHSGSHGIIDAEVYAQPVATNDRWLEAFSRIFEKVSGGAHFGHYEMMMTEARKHLTGPLGSN